MYEWKTSLFSFSPGKILYCILSILLSRWMFVIVCLLFFFVPFIYVCVYLYEVGKTYIIQGNVEVITCGSILLCSEFFREFPISSLFLHFYMHTHIYMGSDYRYSNSTTDSTPCRAIELYNNHTKDKVRSRRMHRWLWMLHVSYWHSYN